jgi:hypothetical protein
MCLVGAFACSEREEKGGLVVVVDTDLGLDKDIDHLRFEAIHDGRPLRSDDHDFGLNGLKLPAKFWIGATGDATPVQIRAIAYKGGIARVQREAITPIPETHVGYLRLPLNYLCDGTATMDGGSTCGDGQTCIAGSCGSSNVPNSGIARTPEGTGSIPSTSGNTCFDVSACFTTAVAGDLALDDCSLPAPDDIDVSEINVGIELEAGAEGGAPPFALGPLRAVSTRFRRCDRADRRLRDQDRRHAGLFGLLDRSVEAR